MMKRVYIFIYKKAVAAVGQGRLMALYDDLFGQFHQPVAQILLTKNDLADVRERVFFFKKKGRTRHIYITYNSVHNI
jgi:glutamate 5-kinase